MLVLSRRLEETVVIGDGIVIKVVDIRGDTVRLGIEAPRDVPVHRGEVYERIQQEKKAHNGNSNRNRKHRTSGKAKHSRP